MAVERAQGSLEILLKEQKKNQYETELLHLLHYSAMNLYSNSLREVDLISGPRRSVRLLTPFREHARRDVTFLDRRRFGQPSKRPCDSAQRAGFSAGGRCFKTTEKKKRCYLNPFARSLRGRLWQLSQRITYLLHYTAVVNSKPISSSSSFCFHHHLAAYMANGRR